MASNTDNSKRNSAEEQRTLGEVINEGAAIVQDNVQNTYEGAKETVTDAYENTKKTVTDAVEYAKHDVKAKQHEEEYKHKSEVAKDSEKPAGERLGAAMSAVGEKISQKQEEHERDQHKPSDD